MEIINICLFLIFFGIALSCYFYEKTVESLKVRCEQLESYISEEIDKLHKGQKMKAKGILNIDNDFYFSKECKQAFLGLDITILQIRESFDTNSREILFGSPDLPDIDIGCIYPKYSIEVSRSKFPQVEPDSYRLVES